MNIKYMRLSREESIDQGNGWTRQESILKNIEADKVYKDVISGSKRERPQLDEMLTNLSSGDIVYIAAIDRLSRSTQDLLDIVDVIKNKGAFLVSVKDSWLDTRDSNPMSTFLLTVMGAIGQLERDMITARIKEGIKAAQDRGVKFGRPRGNSPEVMRAVRMYQKGGKSMREVERITGVSRSSICSVMKKLREAE